MIGFLLHSVKQQSSHHNMWQRYIAIQFTTVCWCSLWVDLREFVVWQRCVLVQSVSWPVRVRRVTTLCACAVCEFTCENSSCDNAVCWCGLWIHLWKFVGIESGAGNEKLDVGSEPCDVLDKTKENVGVKSSLMSLVDYHHTAHTHTHALALHFSVTTMN